MLLWNEVQASRDKEKILNLQEMLTKAQSYSDLKLSHQALGAQSHVVGVIEEKMRAAQFPEELVGVDLYFPEENHRRQWRGDEDLLVAFAPMQDDSEMTSIIAYSVKTAKQLLLDPNEAPSIPTLVIAAKERPLLQPGLPLESPLSPSPQEDLESSSEGNMWIRCLTMFDDHEPWVRGKPEIYVLVGQSYMTTPQEHRIWLNSGSHDVNKEGKRYCFGDTSSNPLYFYFNDDYSDATYFHFMESDGGSSVTIGASVVYKGVTVGLGWAVKDGDDSLGSKYVNKSQASCHQGHRYVFPPPSTGDVEFEVSVLIESDPCPPPIVD
jgi:hypothetical protein